MRERPILFSAPMVRAILDGRKVQTRRIAKPQPVQLPDFNRSGLSYNVRGSIYRAWNPVVMDPRCPYGQPGDRLWVRETFGTHKKDGQEFESPIYRADADSYGLLGLDPDGAIYAEQIRWCPSIHMTRRASRILLEVTDVRVERLNDISEADANAEGARCADPVTGREVLLDKSLGSYRLHFRDIWEQINGSGSWVANPWVWVIEFRRLK